MKTLGYYNGTTGEIGDLRIPMDDRACWFGDGVYDATCAIRQRALFLEEHVDRFFSSAALLQMAPPLSREDLAGLLAGLVRQVEGDRHFLYWQITRGTAPRNHAFPGGKANLWAFIRPSPAPDLTQKVRLITVEDTRFFHCHVKTLNLIPNTLASERAKRAGAAEAVFYRTEATGKGNFPGTGRVTECAHSNIHILAGGAFRTAPLDNLILPGVARAHLIKQCGLLGVPVREEAFSLEELFAADEVIISSSGTYCQAASHIDGRPVGGRDPETLDNLRRAVTAEAEGYIGQKW
ncbi:MAG: aminotransferase class IV [Treponema sp.]|jgi:D-alanine transaminase|nr:aminotransferase class IV [Treponema sp.]